MVSLSSKATTTVESQFRINRPNSRPRSCLVIALDEPSELSLAILSRRQWNGARFRSVRQFEVEEGGLVESDLLLISPEGDSSHLPDELDDVDVVVMVAQSGAFAEVAKVIGHGCFKRNLMTAGVVLETVADPAVIRRTVNQIRPFVLSLVIGLDETSLAETLGAIRA